MRKIGLLTLGVLVLFGASPAWANHIDRGTSQMGVLVADPTDNLTFDGVTFDAFTFSGDPNFIVYDIANFSQFTSITLDLASTIPDFGSFLCSATVTDTCVATNATALSVSGSTFTFPAGASNPADPTDWFFYSDLQGCTSGHDCTNTNGLNNITGISFTPTTTSTPEPASLALLGSGLLAIAIAVRRLRAKQ